MLIVLALAQSPWNSVLIPLLNGYDAAAYMVKLMLIARTTRAVRQLASAPTYQPEYCCFQVFFRCAEVVGGEESRDLFASKLEMRSLSSGA